MGPEAASHAPDPREQRAQRWKKVVRNAMVDLTWDISEGDLLTDSQIRGFQEGASRRWRIHPELVLVSHHGVPIVSPRVDLLSLPRELRQRPELFLADEDRGFRDVETGSDYAERVACLLMLSGLLRVNREGRLNFAYTKRELDPLDDVVWDRFSQGDADTRVVLQMRPMVEHLGREMYHGAVLAGRIDVEEYIEPSVKRLLATLTSELSSSIAQVTSTPARLLDALDTAWAGFTEAQRERDAVQSVESETELRALCAEVAANYPPLVQAYLELVVPFSQGSEAGGDHTDVEMSRSYQYLVGQFEERFAQARGDIRVLVPVCTATLEEFEARVDGNYRGDGPNYPRLPLNLIREFVAQLVEERYPRRERRIGAPPRGVSLPWS